MTPAPDSIRDDAAGYGLGGLDPEETRAFEAALLKSPELRELVAEYREVNALLALGAGAPPIGAELRARVVASVRTAPAIPLEPRRKARTGWLLAGSLAASLLLGLGLALRDHALELEITDLTGRLDSTERRLARREETLNTLLTAEAELTMVQLKATGADAPGLQFFWNRRAHTGVAHAFRLPPAPHGKMYQLWVMQDGKPVPGPVFNSDAGGHALVSTFAIPAGLIQAAAVTLEPAAGSTTPTMPMLLFGQVGGP